MTILVTGGAGYVGSATVEHLVAKGESVVVLDDLKRGHRQALDPSVPFYQGRIGDRQLVKEIVGKYSIESCIHFAAMAYVSESMEKPALYYENNVVQGIEFLSALLDGNVRRVVFSSSCATYGEPETPLIAESNRQWPANPYGWSKLFFERMLDSYDCAYGLRFFSLRYFNAAGATERCGEHHDPESHLIPNVLAVAAGKNPEVEVFGKDYPTEDGTAIRDYVHISDLADAHGRALEYLRGGGRSDFANLGTGHGISILQVIQFAREVTGREIRIRMRDRRAGDPARLVADPARAKNVLRWEPQTSNIRSVLQSAWTWHLRNPDGYSPR